jgi:hypothetical protein
VNKEEMGEEMERIWKESIMTYFLTLYLFCFLPEKPIVAEYFTELEFPFPCSQAATSGPYPRLNESNPHPHIMFNIHSDINFSSIVMSSKFSFSFRFSYQKSVCIFLPFMLHILPISS